jgi:hypothetical protein
MVAREPVELRDDELGLELLAGGQRGDELRPVVGSLAALRSARPSPLTSTAEAGGSKPVSTNSGPRK